MRQIHINVDPEFWDALFRATEAYPPELRTQQGICGFAIWELANDLEEDPTLVLPSPAPSGTKHLQVKDDDAVARVWTDLATSKFDGQYSTMLRVALARLKSWLDKVDVS